jgi:hypothetical protein
VLALLEGGIVLAQLSLLARVLGLSMHVEEDAGVCSLATRAAQFTHWSDMPLASVSLPNLSVRPGSLLQHRRFATVAEVASPYAGCDSFPDVREIVTALQVEQENYRAPERRSRRPRFALEHVSETDVCEMILRRTSANDIDGLAPCGERFDAACLRGVMASWRAISGVDMDGRDDSVRCILYAVVLTCHDGQTGLYRLDAEEPARLERAGDFVPLFQQALTLAQGYNMRQFSMAALVCVDYLPHLETIGPRAFLRVQHEAGRRLHQFCLAAAAYGMFARPIKMYREAVLEHGLAVEGQLIFVALAGFGRRVNIAFDLL